MLAGILNNCAGITMKKRLIEISNYKSYEDMLPNVSYFMKKRQSRFDWKEEPITKELCEESLIFETELKDRELKYPPPPSPKEE